MSPNVPVRVRIAARSYCTYDMRFLILIHPGTLLLVIIVGAKQVFCVFAAILSFDL